MAATRISALLVVAGLSLGASWWTPPLIRAIESGDRERVELLLRLGFDPNVEHRLTQPGHAGASFRVTPLVMAAGAGDTAMVELLIARGADPHWDDGRFTPLEWAIRFGHPETARRLWGLSDGKTYAARVGTSLPLAMRVGDEATRDFILERVGPASCAAAQALSTLAREGAPRQPGELARVRELLDAGVRPTPEGVQAAAVAQRTEMLELLLVRGDADGYLMGCKGTPVAGPQPHLRGALMASVVTLAPEMVQLLLERGADPNTRSGGGITPAMQLAKLYYFKKAYAQPPNSDGPVPSPSPYHELHFAPMLQMLLDHGADLSLRDDAGRGVIDYLNPDDDHDYAYKRAWLERLGAAAPAAPAAP